MRYGKITVLLLTAVLLVTAVFCWQQDARSEPELELDSLFSVLLSHNGETEEFDCCYVWTGERYQFFVVFPGYVDHSQGTIRINTPHTVSINGQLLEDGMACDIFDLNVPYKMIYTIEDISYHFQFQFLQSGDVPTMYIDVQSGSMDYIHEKKGNEESGKVRVYAADGELLHEERADSVNGRGNHTWNQQKKPYSLKLIRETNLLGLGAARNWVLLSNPSDPSQLRNKLVYDYADAAGLDYSPDSEWVDLYLNGEYAGLYLLCERNEIHAQRIDLAADDSFLVSLELPARLANQGYPFIATEKGSALRIHQTSVTPSELKRIWQSAENAILAEDGIDPNTGKHWSEWIDLDSWARKYLIEEIFGNLDACAVSQYFYGDLETGKIYAGPVWDYDMSMGNSLAWQLSSPKAFFANRAVLRRGMEDPWFYALYQDEQFYDYVVALYQNEFRPLLQAFLDTELEQYISQIRHAAETDGIRWGTTDMLSEIESIRAYMAQRIDFLNSVWLEKETYFTVLVNMNEGSNTACYAVKPGEYAPEPPPCDYRNDVMGWYYVDTEEPYDAARPIYEDTEIYLKLSSTGEDQISPFQAVPILAVFVLLIAAFLTDRIRRKRTDIRKHERTNTSQIPS